MVQVVAIDTFILQDIDAKRHGRITKRWINPSLADIVFFPLHIQRTMSHWALIERPKVGKIEAYDSVHLLLKVQVSKVYHILREAAETLDSLFIMINSLGICLTLPCPHQSRTIPPTVVPTWPDMRRGCPLSPPNREFVKPSHPTTGGHT